MKKVLFVILDVFSLLFVACDSSSSISSNAVSKTKINEEVPKFEPESFTLISTDEQLITFTSTEVGIDFDQFKDKKAVIIDIFATWCPPCIESLPDLHDIQNRYKDDMQIVSVLFQDDISSQNLKAFIKEHGINYPITVEGDNQKLADNLNVRRVPEMFLFSKSGKFVHKFVGKVKKEELEKYLKIAIEN